VALVKAAIGASRFTLGLSYHVHVFGLSQGVPAIIAYSGDYYRFKSEGLAGFYAAPTAAADIADAQGEAGAMRAIEALRGAGPEVREDIVTRNRSILASNDWTIAEMSRLLRDRGR
jgi:polysaccharide pyruvyl transferase WcaK-like protein